MSQSNPSVDLYLVEGCGRCSYAATPQCKVHRWSEVLQELRFLMLSTELIETRKWGVPCYTYQNKNVLIISALKESVILSFFKGALLNDPDQILELPGDNSRHGRLIRFTSVDQVHNQPENIFKFVQEAIEIEKSGRKVQPIQALPPIPGELIQFFDTDAKLRNAFYALTPGRQRGYILHFGSAKQSKTRIDRIERAIPAILQGKGLME
jgi:uncharacterized protein YdeI (YjbR/CyaY-like superfamily)